jgi:hypothetical protein
MSLRTRTVGDEGKVCNENAAKGLRLVYQREKKSSERLGFIMK